MADEDSDLATQSESEKTVDLYADTQEKTKKNTERPHGFKNKFHKLVSEIKDAQKATDDPAPKSSGPPRN